MQESEDGCQISQAYLNLLNCQKYLNSIDLAELSSYQKQQLWKVNKKKPRFESVSMYQASSYD